jgi:hypothetical protein
VPISPGAVEKTPGVLISPEAVVHGGVWVSPGEQGGVWVSPPNADIARTKVSSKLTLSFFKIFMGFSLTCFFGENSFLKVEKQGMFQRLPSASGRGDEKNPLVNAQSFYQVHRKGCLT